MRQYILIPLLISSVFLLISCPVYDPPSEVVDSRLKFINQSDSYVQYLCSCDTINGKGFMNLAATINSGILIKPQDTFNIPGWNNWETMIGKCPDNKLTVYV